MNNMKKYIFTILFLFIGLSATSEIIDSHNGIWPITESNKIKRLNGTWDLKVINGISDKGNSIPPKDATWHTIPVPGNWEQYGFCKPTYSFPDSLTGYYRTEFIIPKEWKNQRICIQMDGVLRGYELWLNDKSVGIWELPYNTCIFDLTSYLTKNAYNGEPQQLAMRVYSHYDGYEFDCFDDWTPMGIFRDVKLFAIPEIHLSDLTIKTRNDGSVMVNTDVANQTPYTSVTYEIMDAQGKVVSTGEKIKNPRLWTPETPYLYTLRLHLKENKKELQTFVQKFGFREIEIKNGNILTINGQPIKFRGVTTHATDPQNIKVINEELTLKDLRLMKEASINYIRTSHYPRESRFFELCDSLGFYVMCEVPFGSRGKDHLNDTSYYDNLRTRALATVTRHKNHPSVVIWSLGNENPFTKMCQHLGAYVKSLDDSRYICYPQKGGFKNVNYKTFPKIADIYAPHYPNVKVIEERFKPADRPVILTEYCHTFGTSFEDHNKMWEIIERYPNMTGGSVWEWVDQGMPFSEHRDHPYGYEERVYTSPKGGFEMNGNKGTDGLLYANRIPLPNYYELRRNYAQAFVVDSSVHYDTIGTGNFIRMNIKNRYDFQNLKDNVTFSWTLTGNRDTIAVGAFSPDCAPHKDIEYGLEVGALSSDQLNIISFKIKNKQGYTILNQSFKLNDMTPVNAATLPLDTVFHELKPFIRVGRKMSLSEKLLMKDARIEHYIQPLDNPYVKGNVIQDGDKINYTLTSCDTTNHYLAELGVAYLLDKSIDRVQWIGYGPYASYPGRYMANQYGFWEFHRDDIYFEGNRMGVDACWLSDKNGNGILISGEQLNINFEQTDCGIIVTVNALVSGLGPKFNKTPYMITSLDLKPINGDFRLQYTTKDIIPTLFKNPSNIQAPFKPFFTQYDTYLMRFNDITPENI